MTDSLPSKYDFARFDCGLDAQFAWRNFGGLMLEEAKARFRESPEYHQEDFMWMGGKAFAFYFPVIDEYLRSAPDIVDDDEHEVWILAHCIQTQFTGDNVQHVLQLTPRVIELANFVRGNIGRFGSDEDEC